MLRSAGEDVSRFEPRACREGGNNLVFEIDLTDSKRLAKKYYRSETDKRDRLGAEWSLIAYAQAERIASVPRPYLVDAEHGIGIYEFIDGGKVKSEKITSSHIEAAADFFLALNPRDRHTSAATVPIASEACFSIADHLTLIEQRLVRIDAIASDDELHREAMQAGRAIRAAWRKIFSKIENESAILSGGFEGALPLAQRCISPSDFGFHNALQRSDGSMVFIDFEYAGWDDPAKMAADFFCQPQVPVDIAHLEMFLDRTMSFSEDAEALKARTRLLLPAQRIKWACIMLNDFLPDAARRRQFANPDADIVLRKRQQLDKVARALRTL